jgi:hypothetical protein
MCSELKRYKGKEMGAFWGTKTQQKTYLEGDSDSEQKVKNCYTTSGGAA